MALSRRTRLPLLFSALMGLSVLASDALVVHGLAQRHAGLPQIAYSGLFALLVFAVWLFGFCRTLYFLNHYARESEAIPLAAGKLTELAEGIEERLKEGARSAPRSLSPDTPLLDRRVKEIWRALRRGTPLLSGDMAESEDRQFPGPEREIRALMDIILNVGIAGTFVSILMTLTQAQGLTADTLLAHVGPGMTSGLAAVIANIGLRLCHRTLQDEQDALAVHVDDAVADYFLANVPKAVTCPEERLVAANELVAQSMQDALEYALAKQNAVTQKTLVEQASELNSLLKEHARLISQVLTQQIHEPIQELAGHAGSLAQHSGTWSETAADLKSAHADFIGMHRDAHSRHEAVISTLFEHHRASLDAFQDSARQDRQAAMKDTREAIHQQIEDHSARVTQLMDRLRAEFLAMSAEQEAINSRTTEAGVNAVGNAISAQLAVVEDRIGSTLDMVSARLPEALRSGVKEGLDETVALLDEVREQAAALTHLVGQVAGSADRHLTEHKRWQESAGAAQDQLELRTREAARDLDALAKRLDGVTPREDETVDVMAIVNSRAERAVSKESGTGRTTDVD